MKQPKINYKARISVYVANFDSNINDLDKILEHQKHEGSLNYFMFPEKHCGLVDKVNFVANLFRDRRNSHIITQDIFLIREIYIRANELIVQGSRTNSDFLCFDASDNFSNPVSLTDDVYGDTYEKLLDAELGQSYRWYNIEGKLELKRQGKL